jgi:hypothetical protein
VNTDAGDFVFVASIFPAAILIFVLSVHVRGKMLFRMLREHVDPELWRSLGAPESLIEAFRDTEHRWREFVRSGEYRRRLRQDLADRIDEDRRRTRRMLVIFAIAIALLIYRFWPLLAGT